MLSASRLGKFLPPLLLAGLAVACYFNALTNPFVFDDRTEIVENRSIVDLSNPASIVRGSLTRPLVNFTYALDYAVGGLDPFPYHRTNLLLHVVVVLLLAQLVRRIFEDWGQRRSVPGLPTPATTGFWAAALFAVHPMQTEAVGYISGRAEVLSTALGLMAFFALRRAALSPSVTRSLVAVGAVVLALASKESAVMVPVVFLAYDRLLLDQAGASKRWRYVHLPVLGFMAVAGAARVAMYLFVEHPSAPRLAWVNLLVLPEVVVRYLSLLFVPAGQSIVQEVFPITSVWTGAFLLPVFALVTCGAGLWALRRRHPILALGSLWFVLFLLPAAALLLFNRGQPMAEHRVYLASCGFFLVAAYGLAWIRALAGPAVRLALSGVVVALVAVLCVLTINRNQAWDDPVRLWADAAAKAPNTWAARYGLASALRGQGDCGRAVAEYEKAASLLPRQPEAFVGLAVCLSEMGRTDDARHALLTALERNPENALIRLALADFYEGQQNPAEALKLCVEAKALGGDAKIADECIARNRVGG